MESDGGRAEMYVGGIHRKIRFDVGNVERRKRARTEKVAELFLCRL